MSTSVPFGNPDGSRSDIDDVLGGFVDFDEFAYGNGLGIRPDGLSVRIIVGAKGSGKTVYVRRMQAFAESDKSRYAAYPFPRYADALQQEAPATRNIAKFCQCYSPERLREAWSQLWYCAILRSVISHVLNAPALRAGLSAEERNQLLHYAPSLFPRFSTPVPCCSQVTDIIQDYDRDRQYDAYFDDPAWPEVKHVLGEIMRHLPPVFLFIDALDENYDAAPTYWMRCQEGLFTQVMLLLRDPRLGGSLHVVITIREHVLASMLRSEHQTKYRGEPHIRVLNWGYRAIVYLLHSKIQRLDQDFLIKPDASEPMERWLGYKRIENEVRVIAEDVTSYLLRHSRLLPRDIICLGNSLSLLVAHEKARGSNEVSQAAIRAVVSRNARVFASEQIVVCANQIVSSGMPADGSRHDYSWLYTGDAEYVRTSAEELRALLSMLGSERLTYEQLQDIGEKSKAVFGDSSDVLSVLWQNRLLGYLETTAKDSREMFFSERELQDYNLPLGKAQYLLHSCLIDGVGIQPVGSLPVLGSPDFPFET